MLGFWVMVVVHDYRIWMGVVFGGGLWMVVVGLMVLRLRIGG